MAGSSATLQLHIITSPDT